MANRKAYGEARAVAKGAANAAGFAEALAGKNGAIAEAAATKGGRATGRILRAAGAFARKAFSVALSVMLVLTMSPLAGSGAALAAGSGAAGGGSLKTLPTS